MWPELREPWERVRWARMFWQSRSDAVNLSAADAARSLGIEPGTYRAYERAPDSSKQTKLDHQRASQFSAKFRVSWIWLLKGEGTPFDDRLPEPQERVVQAMSLVSEDRQKYIADAVEALLKTGT